VTASTGRRLGVEAASAGLSFVLLLTTLVWHEWIELVFHVDPDHENGLVEWAIVGLCFTATVVFSARARARWKQLRVAT